MDRSEEEAPERMPLRGFFVSQGGPVVARSVLAPSCGLMCCLQRQGSGAERVRDIPRQAGLAERTGGDGQ
jgi:hypothetical protein